MGRKRAIICFETEERFESVTDAANAIGAAWPLVSSALKRHGEQETVGTRYSFRHGRSVRESRFMKARGAMTMDDCGSEKTIHYEEEGTQDGAKA